MFIYSCSQGRRLGFCPSCRRNTNPGIVDWRFTKHGFKSAPNVSNHSTSCTIPRIGPTWRWIGCTGRNLFYLEITFLWSYLCFVFRIQFDIGAPDTGATSASFNAVSQPQSIGGGGLLGDIFGLAPSGGPYVAEKTMWLPAVKGKGLEISGTFARRYA